MVIENRPFGVRTSVIIWAKTLRCQNISKLIYFDGKTDLTQTREKITRVRGNQAGISCSNWYPFLLPSLVSFLIDPTFTRPPTFPVEEPFKHW